MTELTDEQINKRIHEIMGLCQHKWEPFAYGTQTWYRCDCGDISSKIIEVYNFTGDWQTSAYEFGMMWEFMQKHEQWEAFCEWYDIDGHPSLYTIDLISPPTLSRAVVDFFKEAHD